MTSARAAGPSAEGSTRGRRAEDEPLPARDPHSSPSGEAAGGASETPAENEGEEALVRLQTENADLKDRLLRALADADNLRRRTEREVDDARQYAVTQLAHDMTGVADNFDRALQSVSQGQGGAEAFATLMHGIELTRKELLRALERSGIRRFEPLGERFDPNVHDAVFEKSDPGMKPGTVAEVMSPGYMIGSRVLRPAKVGVASEPRDTAS